MCYGSNPIPIANMSQRSLPQTSEDPQIKIEQPANIHYGADTWTTTQKSAHTDEPTEALW